MHPLIVGLGRESQSICIATENVGDPRFHIAIVSLDWNTVRITTQSTKRHPRSVTVDKQRSPMIASIGEHLSFRELRSIAPLPDTSLDVHQGPPYGLTFPPKEGRGNRSRRSDRAMKSPDSSCPTRLPG